MALMASPALVATSAEAMPAPGPGAVCIGTAADAAATARRLPDTPAVSTATRKRIQQRLAADQQEQAAASARSSTVVLPTYRVNVQIHVIHGTHRHERSFKRSDAHLLYYILRGAYNGTQSPSSQGMGVTFVLTRVTVSKNDKWYHARPMSRWDKQMKKKLHRGSAQTLNIYVNKPTFSRGGLLLGYSRFPWQYRSNPKLDGVTVNVRGMPGGNAWNYNKGDTVVHETGHWLGLLHTFQGGTDDPRNPQCDAFNDGVPDTPAEWTPNFTCAPDVLPYLDPRFAKSTVCDQQAMVDNGYADPALNFMDYSFDACMRMFTEGQHVRVAGLYRQFRLGR